MGKMTLMTALTLNAAGFSDGINGAIKDSKEFVTAINGAGKDTVKAFKDISEMGIGEMRRNLKELKNLSFAGKSKEEIHAINAQIGELTDTMGDLKAQQKGMGIELGSAMAGGLQTISAVAEGVVGVASLFGASKEQAEKYQQVMVSLIGVTQAFGVIEAAIMEKQFQVIATRLAETAATVAQTIATKFATAANWLLNASIGATLAIIGATVLVVAALAAGMYYLYSWLSKSTEAEKEQYLAIKLSNDERIKSKEIIEEVGAAAIATLLPQKVHIEALVAALQNENLTLTEKKKALKELIALDPSFLQGLDLANISTEKGKNIIANYIQALSKKAEGMALEAQLVKLYSNQYTDKLAYENLLIGIQAEKIMLINGLKNMSFGFGEAEDLRNKIALEETLAITTKARIDGNIKGIDSIQNRMAKLKPLDVEYNTGGGAKIGDKSKPEAKGAISTENVILGNRLKGAEVLNQASNEKLIAIRKDYDSNIANMEKSNLEDNKSSMLKQGTNFENFQNDKLATQKAFNNRNKKQYEIDADNYKDLLDKKLITETQYAQAIKEIEKAKNKSNLQVIGDTFGSIAGLFKENTIAYKVMASAQAMINAFLAASAASASVAAIPIIGAALSPIAYGAALAQGLMAVASINGVQFANGGIVGGSSYSGDLIPARLNSKEMVLNQGQQANLFAMANGAGGGAGGELSTRISGNDLLFVLNRTYKKNNNTR